MNILSLVLLAVSLCFDTFAVSLSGGVRGNYTAVAILKIMLVMAAFQTAMLIIGWLLGSSVSAYIAQLDHWVAFALLAFIGGKMVLESFEKDKEQTTNFQSNRVLFVIALATSIDAIAVGVSLALVDLSSFDLWMVSTMLFATTAAAAFIGLIGGSRLGKRIGKRAELLGGVILILIGLKILLEHLLG